MPLSGYRLPSCRPPQQLKEEKIRKVAVITDAMSTGHYFPNWFSYYSASFGSNNLHVVTFKDNSDSFDAYDLGCVWKVGHAYSDQVRAKLISKLCSALLATYDVVIRCDVDEFLVPANNEPLHRYLQSCDQPYVTAMGFDIIEMPNEPKLNYALPIIGVQRVECIPSTALNKTCITSTSIRWAAGFHSASVFPAFDGLLLFHTKFADISGRTDWFDKMLSGSTPGTTEYAYFSDGLGKLSRHQDWCSKKASGSFPNDISVNPFQDQFLRSVKFNPENGIYQGNFMIGEQRLPIPSAFRGLF